jgi:hypothetical protein
MTALILERPMCVECTATKASMPTLEAQHYLKRLREPLRS